MNIEQLTRIPDDIDGGELGRMLGQLTKTQLVTALVAMSGANPAAFRSAMETVNRIEVRTAKLKAEREAEAREAAAAGEWQL